MDSHVVNSRTEGEDHEKTSVLNQVKAKAMKLKDTITGNGHGLGQDPEGQHTPDDHDLDEDDDEDVDEPEVHSAPIYDSAPMKRTDAPVQGDVLKVPSDTRAARDERSDVGISDPARDVVPGQNRTTGHEDLLGGARTEPSGPTTGPVLRQEEPKKLGNVIGEEGPHGPPVASFPHGNYNTAMDVDPSKTGHSGQTGVKLGKTDVIGEGTPVPLSTPVSSLPHGTDKSTMEQGGHLGQSRVNLDRPRGLEEDPHSPEANPQPSNYETEVTDPSRSGGEEIGGTPILHSFDKMNLHGDDRQSGTTHDQQAPNLTTEKPSNQSSSYTEKVSSATTAIADKAISATNVVASKLGYGWTEKDHDLKLEKISSATSAIADKAISAKKVVASKLGYGGSGQVHDRGDATGPNVQSGSAAPEQHGKTITSRVCKKVAGAGTAVMSKIQGSGTGRDSPSTARNTNQAGPDKGTARDTSFRPNGKVTESEEVRQRSGDTEGNENFVVDRVKKSVGSMIGGTNNGDDNDGIQQSLSGSAASEHRRLQDSGN